MSSRKLKIILGIAILFSSNIHAQDLCGNYSKLSLDSLKSKIVVIERTCLDSNDMCLDSLIEYFKENYIRTDKRIFLELIDSCWANGDGWVGDLLQEVSFDLFDEKFEGWYKYVYENRNDTINRGYSTIKNLFIEGMREEGKETAKQKIDSAIASAKYTQNEKKYLKVLFDKTNFNEF